ncbi:hypothetical protein GCM10010923_09520 [Blastomonas marina]|uniref:Uncharacterized protein n=2 Tax=Blastomonas marina TaxID=1867408 RepID=A0ABQ1F9G4_9SPHN|nr:hypothetical protein GCM10010923_09520 [Blastomonas marina]
MGWAAGIAFYTPILVFLPLLLWLEWAELPDTEIVYAPSSGVWAAGGFLVFVTSIVAGVSIYRWCETKLSELRSFFVAAVMWFAWVFSGWLLLSVADTIERVRAYFPADQVERFEGYVSISRAYFSEGYKHKKDGWIVQTSPVFLIMDITENDFRYMLDNAPAGMVKDGGTEISSRGHFCALMSFERGPRALRILNSGRKPLEMGSVVECPEDVEKVPLAR